MWNGYKVVDADAHMHEPQDMWEKYVERKYLAQAPKVAYMNGTFMVYEPDGKIIAKDEKAGQRPSEAVVQYYDGGGCLRDHRVPSDEPVKLLAGASAIFPSRRHPVLPATLGLWFTTRLRLAPQRNDMLGGGVRSHVDAAGPLSPQRVTDGESHPADFFHLQLHHFAVLQRTQALMVRPAGNEITAM
jgi:hypothetical protein